MTVTPEMLRLLDEAARNSLQELRDLWFFWLVVSAVVVAVGVVVEGPEIFKDIREAFSDSGFSKKIERRIALLSAIGWLLVAVGVAGEFVAEVMVSKADALIQTFDLGLLADAQKQTAFALSDAESAKALAKGFESQIAASAARVKIAEAQVATAMAVSVDAASKVAAADARSAEASAKAESFRLDIATANESAKKADARAVEASLELAKFKAPRTLTQEQRDRLIGKLKPMTGQTFSFTVDFDPEAFDFLRILDLIFRKSGWIRIPSQIGDVEIGGAGMAIGSGVAVQLLPGFSAELKNRAESLAAMLTDEGVIAVAVSNPTLKNPNAINVMVGKKP